jgi:UDP-N-acetylmuramoyl-L-alanyl-D-glutamate--2,6-diaminopimelate ligase
MKLNTLLKNVSTVVVSGKENPSVKGIAYDSRQVQQGYLFVAVSGHNTDGADYVAQALSNGASVVVSEHHLELGSDVAHVQVEDARLAMAEIATRFYGDLSSKLTVVGVTGTNGKTTTTYMIRDILKGVGRTTGLLGTVAYEVGNRAIPATRTTPEAPDIHSMFEQMMEAGCDSVVMEVSSHAISLKRVHGIDFDVRIFTNLTQDHLDYHNDMETYYNVKAELFRVEHPEHGRCCVINIDDPWGQKLAEEKEADAQLITYGFDERAVVRATKASLKANGTIFNVYTPWGAGKVKLQLLGRFNIHNALAAIAAGCACGIELKSIIRSLGELNAVPGRLEPVSTRKGRKVFVDYAHTDDAMKNVLTTLREICKGRLIIVFGCGGNRDHGKRAKMGRVAAELADYSIVTSDNPRDEEPAAIASEVIEGFDHPKQYEVVLDRQSAILKGLQLCGRRDILLIAGKGHEAYQEIKGAVIPFDDRETVRELAG